jgi:cyclase
MLAHRVIPTILCRGRALVKGVGFDSSRSVGLAAQAVRIHQTRGVDEVVLLDVAATKDGRGPDLKLVEELADGCFMPLAVGGGVRAVDQVRDLLRSGADKVVIGSAALREPGLLKELSATVGCQAIVASMDVKGGVVHIDCGKTPVMMSQIAAVPPQAQAQWLQNEGAGEILLQSVERDGTMRGYDLDLIRSVSQAVDIPVVASGGCSGYADMLAAIQAGASAVAAGALFQFTDATPKEAAQYLAQHGIEARV